MGNAVFFFSQKVDREMIFTWSFWAFRDIPGIVQQIFAYFENILVFQNQLKDDVTLKILSCPNRSLTSSNCSTSKLTYSGWAFSALLTDGAP